ncbi:MAG: hypothetical protein BWY15_00771 [Firmicutes bacterium ADurb.Bin193]|nr:MAG: hypothetical protein BWY15_00771 [Firmicutes bacterium ADurb.Bin193]
MSESIDRAIGQLKDMLSTEEGQKELENIIHSAGGGQSDNGERHLPSASGGAGSNLFNSQSMMKIARIMDSMQMDNDPRVNLLTALRPYISKNRGAHLDHAIKIMSLGKLPYLLKNIKK